MITKYEAEWRNLFSHNVVRWTTRISYPGNDNIFFSALKSPGRL